MFPLHYVCGPPPLPAPRGLCASLHGAPPPSSLYLHSPLSTGSPGTIRSHHFSAQGLPWLSILLCKSQDHANSHQDSLCHVPTDSAPLPVPQRVRARPATLLPQQSRSTPRPGPWMPCLECSPPDNLMTCPLSLEVLTQVSPSQQIPVSIYLQTRPAQHCYVLPIFFPPSV